MVEGQLHLEDAVVQARVPVSDGLHYWNRSKIVLGRSRPGHATPVGTLYGLGLLEGGASKEDSQDTYEKRVALPFDPSFDILHLI